MINSQARLAQALHIGRGRSARWSAILAALVFFGCSSRDSAPAAKGTAAADIADSANAPGRGHLHLTGDASMDTDFTVEQCAIGPAGEGLLNGYHMNAKSSHGSLEMLSVVVKDYERDGVFAPVAKPVKAMTSKKQVLMGPVSMLVNRSNSTVPLSILAKPESKLLITISDSGASGAAQFSELTSPIAMEDIDIKLRGRAKGKSFAGSLTWRCPSVEHVDPRTRDAAKGMLKGLTPIY